MGLDMPDGAQPRSVFEYMANNRIAVMLGTAGLLALGLIALANTTVERYPAMDLRRITITVPYDGATPREVEEDILRRIEESLASLDGVDRITANAWEGKGEVIVEFKQWQDTVAKLDVVRTAVEGIEDFRRRERMNPRSSATRFSAAPCLSC